MASRKFHINKKLVPEGNHALWDIVLPPDARRITGVMIKAYNRSHATVNEQRTEYSEYLGDDYGYGNPIFGTDEQLKPGDIQTYLNAFSNPRAYYANLQKQAGYATIDTIIEQWKALPGGDINTEKIKEAATTYEEELKTRAYSGVDSDVEPFLFIHDKTRNRLYEFLNDIEIFDVATVVFPQKITAKNIFKILYEALKALTDDGVTPTEYYKRYYYTKVWHESVSFESFNAINPYYSLKTPFYALVEQCILLPFLQYMINTEGIFEWSVYVSDDYSSISDLRKQEIESYLLTYSFNEWVYFNTIKTLLDDIVQIIIQLNPKITPASILYHQEIVGNISLMTNMGYSLLLRDMPVQLNDNKVTIRTDLQKVNEPVYVGTQWRAAFKNNKTFDDDFTIDIYFEYEKN